MRASASTAREGFRPRRYPVEERVAPATPPLTFADVVRDLPRPDPAREDEVNKVRLRCQIEQALATEAEAAKVERRNEIDNIMHETALGRFVGGNS